jgi:hypothetical protein
MLTSSRLREVVLAVLVAAVLVVTVNFLLSLYPLAQLTQSR